MPNRLAEIVVTPRGNYINYQGGETYIPTLEEYNRAEADKKSVNAVYNILNQNTPVVPDIPDQGIISKIAGKFGMSDEERINRFGKCKNPLTCINTVTAMYGQDSTVSGNKTFANNPERYGFEETNTPEVGNIMQFYNKGIPHHATMITGFNFKKQPVLSYSNGSASEYSTDKDGHLVKSMKYDNDNWNPNWVEEDDRTSLYSIGNKTKVYKFVGTEKDKQKWENEYNKKYPKHKLGNKIRFHQNGGGLTTGNEYADLALSFVPIVGSVMDISNAIADPSFKNISTAVVSTGLDLLGGSLIKGALKSARLANKATQLSEKLPKVKQALDVAKRNLEINPTKGNRATVRRKFKEYKDTLSELNKVAPKYSRFKPRRVPERKMPKNWSKVINPYTVYGTDAIINGITQFSE